ncbi:amino acid adenylation domain-containing protein [Microbulbifer sp. CnH-101-G]|uniref:amino acid adenylation domain-containing protein n=1 Tax=Microbulbifer sp. CnH-101-G TaxID=3243393 RepID=UPI0040390A49
MKEIKNIKCIHDVLEDQIRATPNRVAIVDGTNSITYKQLHKRVNILSGILHQNRIEQNTGIAIHLPRSLELVTAIFSVLKSGSYFIPLDPEQPIERKKEIIKSTKVKYIITNSKKDQDLFSKEANLIDVGIVDKIRYDDTKIEINPKNSSVPINNLAYIAFTSGTTGVPKGVMVDHEALYRRLISWKELLKLSDNPPCVLNMASPSVDICFGDMLKSLLVGGKLVICDKNVLLSPPDLFELMETNVVTLADFVPSLLRVFADYLISNGKKLSTLDYILIGCEAWYGRDLTKIQNILVKKTRCLNIYGQTESLIDVTYNDVTNLTINSGQVVPIGQGLQNTGIYILNEQNQIQPLGVPGELCVLDKALARGYWENDDETKQKFIKNLINKHGPNRIYKTGDYALRTQEGILRFVGRKDDQVKVRGYRVEISEIEDKLISHPKIDNAIVLIKKDSDEQASLIAYIICKEECGKAIEEEISSFMENSLPSYMIPRELIIIDEFPKSETGKINRKALSKIESRRKSKKDNNNRTINATEDVLLQIVKKILNQDDISINDNFFSIGGDSIRAIQLSIAAKEKSVEVSARDIFEYQTVELLAKKVKTKNSETIKSTIPFSLLKDTKKYYSKFNEKILDAYPALQIQSYMLDTYGNYLGVNGIFHPQQSIEINDENLSIEALKKALFVTANRHWNFRTRFIKNDQGEYIQVIYKETDIDFNFIDLRDIDQSSAISKIRERDLKKPFEVENINCPLTRFYLIRKNSNSYELIISSHHAVDDGWSFIEFLKEVKNRYDEFYLKKEISIGPNVKNCIKERVALEIEASNSDTYRKFWDKFLANYKPMRKPDVIDAHNQYQTEKIILKSELISRLNDWSEKNSVSLKSIFFFAYIYALKKLLKMDNLTVDVVTSARSDRMSSPLTCLGLFWNLLPINIQLKNVDIGQIKEIQTKIDLLNSYAMTPFNFCKKQDNDDLMTYASFNFVQFHNIEKNKDLRSYKVGSGTDRFSYLLSLFISLNENATFGFIELNYFTRYFSKTSMKSAASEILNILKNI